MIEGKDTVIQHYRDSINQAAQWKHITDKKWRTPIAEGKWTIGEVAGHFIRWDDFVRTKRIPFFQKGGPFPESPDVHQTNQESAAISRQRSQEETIAAFIEGRQKLIAAIQLLDDEGWEREFLLKHTPITLSVYFQGQIEHDKHHFRQIESARHER